MLSTVLRSPAGAALVLLLSVPARPGSGALASGQQGEWRAAGQEAAAREAAAPDSPDRGAWNGPRVLELARAAIEARRRGAADSALRAFRAHAEGYVYFLGEFAGRRQLARADQVALEIYWQGADRTLQTIVGRRHEKRLPTDIRYHIDHLAVVLDNYGDRIRLGEGEEVRDVLHPAAPGALSFYEYRLADSLEIRTRDRTTRVYRVHVRPADPRAPGVVGTLYIDRDTGAIARMGVTFTAAAYVDPHVAHITLDLRSALWNGRHWLPSEQEVEIRRQVSWLSYPVGGIIRTRFRIGEYEFDPPGLTITPGSRVASLPERELAAYDEWSASLHAGPVAAEERSRETLEEMRARARELISPRALAGSRDLRLHLPNASGAVRARRAEGMVAGAGASYRAGGRGEVSGWAGWPFSRNRPEAELAYGLELGSGGLEARVFVNRLADIGPFQAESGTLATFAFALHGEDYTDPYFEHGGELRGTVRAAGARASLGLHAARHVSAALVAATPDGDARPVRPIAEGTMVELVAEAERELGRAAATAWAAAIEGRAGLDGPGDFDFRSGRVEVRGRGEADRGTWSWSVRAAAGAAGGHPPPQRLFLLGGRGTVPGYGFRPWAGDRFTWGEAEVARDVVAPWVRLRGRFAAGWTGLGEAGAAAAEALGAGASGGVRPAAGAGLGLFYDILRLDLVKGLRGGEWTLLFSVDPTFWPIL